MAHAEWLLSQRIRTRLLNEGEGLFLANPGRAPFSGWVRLNATSLRGDFQSLEPPGQSERWPLYFDPGLGPWHRPGQPEDLTPENAAATHADNVPRRVARFWIEHLPGESVLRLTFSPQAAPPPPSSDGPVVRTDANGWPATARWPAMDKPLFLPGFGDFLAVQVNAFAPRWALLDIAYAGSAEQRDRLRRERLVGVWATPEGAATVEETPHTVRYTQ